MAPKKNPPPSSVPPSTAAPSQPSAAQTPQKTPTTAIPATPKSSSTSSSSASTRNPQTAQDIALSVYRKYVDQTPQRTKLVDTFMAFLVVVGVIQFVYCVLFGNFPFNAFLSGFSATVGQFVLTASLRMQTSPDNKGEFKSISPERAFADYILGSLILHFFCVNFIN
ncbi:dolichyl-diphosphooligosaccharide--protein glycosyltransferase subunit [Elsinoe australis]|uniref:Dolichyl-diphosphooligosaccharide--protein glycosyltransferase subunit OST2 n=1 Tax=Elsinoe australis TaxID=40998 RepID=A0A4U7BG36_9PEZI|nr:dolichyl-diphosphooligosaccharide--protein glycosyltransferase subunit [Elsinoe australis]